MSGKPLCAPILALAVVFLARAAGNPDEALAQAQERLRAMTRRLPNYACIETVDRSYYTAGDHRLESTDRLRLEVAVSQGREIHSWPGATRFDTRRAEDIVGEGPVGTGAFATYLQDIFDNPGVTFEPATVHGGGEDGTLVYRFHVPLEASHYRVKAGASWLTAAYGGSIRIDPRTLDLARLQVQVEHFPAASPMSAAETTLDYRRLRIGDGEMLLPRRSELRIRMAGGRETDNLTTFAECREYQAESELHFDDDAEAGSAGAKAAVRAPLAMPLGLPLILELTAPLDSDTIAAGDLVEARVAKPVRRPGSDAVLIPEGALVRGRITRAEHHLLPEPYFLVALAFDRLERGGTSSPFFASLDQGEELARRLGARPPARGRGVERWARGVFLFPTRKDRYVVPAGYRSRWMTLATSGL